MHRTCTAPSCSSPVSARYSPYCGAHRHALARNGDILQTYVRATELAPMVKLLTQRMTENPDSPAWSLLRARWAFLVDRATSTVALAQAGRPHLKVPYQAAMLVLSIAGAASADLVVKTALAVALHSLADPRRYLSDRALVFQIARRVVRLAPGAVGRRWCNKTKTSRTVQRDIPPKVLEFIGLQLRETFGGPAAVLWHAEQTRRPPEEVERQALVDALQALRA